MSRKARYYQICRIWVKVGPGRISDNWGRKAWTVYWAMVVLLIIWAVMAA